MFNYVNIFLKSKITAKYPLKHNFQDTLYPHTIPDSSFIILLLSY